VVIYAKTGTEGVGTGGGGGSDNFIPKPRTTANTTMAVPITGRLANMWIPPEMLPIGEYNLVPLPSEQAPGI
jgi:hypothetical protein